MARLPKSLAQWAAPSHPSQPLWGSSSLASSSRLCQVLLDHYPLHHGSPIEPLAANHNCLNAGGRVPSTLSAAGSSHNGASVAVDNRTTRSAPHAAVPSKQQQQQQQQQRNGQADWQTDFTEEALKQQPGLTKGPGKKQAQREKPMGKKGGSEKQAQRAEALGRMNLTQRRPQSAGFQGPNDAQGNKPAEKGSWHQPRARSTSPNSHYNFSSTSSVPDGISAWQNAVDSSALQHWGFSEKGPSRAEGNGPVYQPLRQSTNYLRAFALHFCGAEARSSAAACAKSGAICGKSGALQWQFTSAQTDRRAYQVAAAATATARAEATSAAG